MPFPAETPPPPAQTWPRWIAHRGAGRLAPENTLAAFLLGAQHGFRAFECDVKLSADGVPFLLHDATLERTTNGLGPANALSWPELARLSAGAWHSRAYAQEPLPTLAGIAQFVQAQGAWLDLEIKPSPGTDELTGRLVAQAAAALWPASAPSSSAAQPAGLLLSSFSVPALQAAQQAAPQLARALLLDELGPGWQAAAQALGACAVITQYRLMTPELLAWLHQHGYKAMVYTVNQADAAARLLAMGVDSIITDAVDHLPAVVD